MRRIWRSILVCAMGLVAMSGPAAAQEPGDIQSQSAIFGNNSLDPPVPTKGDDYFTADSDPKTQAWLALVEGRHAGTRQRMLVQQGLYTEVLGDCRYTLERFPNHPLALTLLVEIAKIKNQPTKPIAFFENALRFYPQHAYTHAQYGKFLIDIGATSAGIDELVKALSLDPTLFQARAWLVEARADRSGAGAGARADSTRGAAASPTTSKELR
jgi:tetratricopeptide (TPR) repeat protein